MAQIGRRIFFNNTTGEILFQQGEIEGNLAIETREKIDEINYIDIPYGQDFDKFQRIKSYHIDLKTKTVIFDELLEPIIPLQQQVEDLQNELLQSKGII